MYIYVYICIHTYVYYIYKYLHTALVAPLPFLGTVFLGPDVPRSLEFLKKQSVHATRSSQIVSALAFACNRYAEFFQKLYLSHAVPYDERRFG